MIDINNKIFNYYEPSQIIDEQLNLLQKNKVENVFTDSIYIISEKYIPLREKAFLINQFYNLVTNYNYEKSKIYEKKENNLSGTEVIFTREFLEINTQIIDYCLVDSNFLLMDLTNNTSKIDYSNFEELKNQNIIPIISHPERIDKLTDLSEIRKLKKNGVLFQLSLGSLDGSFGELTRLNSKKLLAKDTYDFIASDTVNYKKIDESYLEIRLDEVSEIIGHSKLDQIIYKNPLNIIDHKNSNNYQI